MENGIYKNVEVTEKMEISPLSHNMIFTNIKATQLQLDALFMILAEIGKDTDNDKNRNYQISSEQFMKMKHYANLRSARKAMKENVVGDENKDNALINIHTTVRDDKKDYVKAINWFSWAEYDNGMLRVCLTPEVKEELVELKKNGEYKIFALLKYLLPMTSQYSKQIYLMCKNYVSSGKMYAMDFNKFCEILEIPDSYSLNKIENLILDKAQKEINEFTDLSISYEIEKEAVRGGNKAKSICFCVKRNSNTKIKQKSKFEVNRHITRQEPVVKNKLSNNTYKARNINNAFNNFHQREYNEDFKELEDKLICNR